MAQAIELGGRIPSQDLLRDGVEQGSASWEKLVREIIIRRVQLRLGEVEEKMLIVNWQPYMDKLT